MEIVPVGAKQSCEQLVTPDLAIDFLGPETARVLSTPSLIGLFERTCRNLLREFLPQGLDSVGVWVELRHLAPTPVGMRLTLDVEVISVEGKRVTFKLKATDEWEGVAEGAHQRHVVDVQRFDQRVRQKAAGRPPG
ncbi:MAG: thioesterase family protein [Bryobacterales bacterium]|nr:thioesterase family protein [Bryobacteraceae bacterium]MDW8129634.1 thioesterase family protein [Bryobacterales bacterium]